MRTAVNESITNEIIDCCTNYTPINTEIFG